MNGKRTLTKKTDESVCNKIKKTTLKVEEIQDPDFANLRIMITKLGYTVDVESEDFGKCCVLQIGKPKPIRRSCSLSNTRRNLDETISIERTNSETRLLDTLVDPNCQQFNRTSTPEVVPEDQQAIEILDAAIQDLRKAKDLIETKAKKSFEEVFTNKNRISDILQHNNPAPAAGRRLSIQNEPRITTKAQTPPIMSKRYSDARFPSIYSSPKPLGVNNNNNVPRKSGMAHAIPLYTSRIKTAFKK